MIPSYVKGWRDGQPGVLYRLTLCIGSRSLSKSWSPAILVQAEGWFETDQPHASCSNEQYEPKGRAPGKEKRSYYVIKQWNKTDFRVTDSVPEFPFQTIALITSHHHLHPDAAPPLWVVCVSLISLVSKAGPLILSKRFLLNEQLIYFF